MIKNLIKSVLSYIIFLPIVGSLFLLDIQNIFNFNQIFWYILAVYLVFSILVLIFKKFRQKENFWYFAKFSIIFIIALLPGFLLGYFYGESIENNIILRITGRVAFLYLALALIISPIISLLKGKYSEQLVLIRKIFGIQAFLFFLLHGLNYIEIERYYYYGDVSFLVYLLENLKNRYDAISGIVAGVIMLLLGVTSNKFSQRVLGKIWKGLHYLVYPLFLLTMLHIAFAGRFDEFYAIILIVVVSLRFIVFLKDFNKQTTQNTNKKTTKYICVVCGYIYDEKKGDPDGGLPPGTKFEDIPEDWVCPVCGVTKKDFEPYYEDEETENTNIATIQNISYLTKDVVKFVIKTTEKLNYTTGQFVKIGFKDFDGKFVRQYSISKNDENSYTFLIKLNPYGRAGKLIPKLGEGDEVSIEGVFGEFKLQNNDNKKVFIATGTGLAPIYNMLINTPSQTEKELYFCVEKYEDLFFQNELESIENLKINYHLSKEDIKGFNYGRIDLSNISFDENTEFYICGNPNMVSEKVSYLQEKGYKNIYYEKFL